MTDDQTRPIETPKPTEPVPGAPAEPAPVSQGAGASTPQPADAPAPQPADAPAAEPAAMTPPAQAQGPEPAFPPATPTGPDYPPVATAPVRTAGPGRGRWVLALGIAGALVALTVGALLFLGRSSLPEALKYVPADAAAVVELRPELPGDQMEKLGKLLAHFPGFADQATLPEKLDEALTRIVSSGSGGEVDYRADVKPWFNGPTFIAVMAPPEAATAEGADEMLLSATTNGAASCAAAFEGQATTQEQYKGFTLVLSGDGNAACVVDGRQALLGEPATVRKGLDAKSAGNGMDTSDRYLAARAALPGDQLATVFVIGEAVRDLAPAAGEELPLPDLGMLTGAIPDWTFVGVRAEDDALIVETVAAPGPQPTNAPSLLALPPVHASVVASMVPSDTLLLIENQGTGVSLQNLLARVRTIPEAAAPLQILEGVGGAEELISWIDDAAITLRLDGSDPRLAVLLVANTEAAAADRAATLSSLLGLLALSGRGVDIDRTTVNGVEVTSVTIEDAGALVPPGSIPGGEEIPATGPVSFSFAVKGRALVLSSGPEAMAAILNVSAGQSLADSATFAEAGSRGLANSRTSVYVAAGAALDLVQPLLPEEIAALWTTELAPYLDPIEAIGITTVTSDTGPNRSRFVITVGP